MKTKVLFLLAIASFISLSTFAQKSVRIGYIDTEYILQNVPEYQSASTQLDTKVDKWKKEIEKRLSDIDQKKKQLSSESVLLTPELIQERQEDINIEENEVLDYQQKRFGPNGDLMIQRKQLMQPIQDQIFTAVQEIASSKNYDFVFDKSADVVMLYSADRFDISDQVLRSITRTAKRTQVQNRKEKKAAEAEEVVPEINESQEARAQALADKKAEREKDIADKRAKQQADREAKKKALEEKRQQILEERAKARQEKLYARSNAGSKANDAKEEATKAVVDTTKKVEEVKTETKKVEEPKLSAAEKRKKALEDKKKKILADRQAKIDAQKAEKEAAKKTTDSTGAKKLSPKEARKKALEEKKQKILADRKAKLEAKRVQDSINKAKKKKNN